MSEQVKTGRIPGGLVPGWGGVVYYFETYLLEPKAEDHEQLVKPLIDKQVNDSYDHGQQLRPVRTEAVIWERYRQVTLVEYYVRDSY